MLQKISGHLIRVVAGTVALFVAHMNPLVYIPRQSIPIHARIVNDSGGMVGDRLFKQNRYALFLTVFCKKSPIGDLLIPIRHQLVNPVLGIGVSELLGFLIIL